MTWFKVDDGLHSHRKTARAGIAAMGLWVVAGSWSADQLTDGWVPDYMAARLDPEYKKHAAALVRAGLWHEEQRDGEKGWVFHQWSEQGRQPTRVDVEEERSRKAAAGRRGGIASGRSRKRAAAEAPAEAPASPPVEAGASRVLPEVPNSRPVPSRPVPFSLSARDAGALIAARLDLQDERETSKILETLRADADRAGRPIGNELAYIRGIPDSDLHALAERARSTNQPAATPDPPPSKIPGHEFVDDGYGFCNAELAPGHHCQMKPTYRAHRDLRAVS